MEFLVDLNLVENVKKFVKVASTYDTSILVKSSDRSYSVDGSSLMGLFSLDLGKPVVVCIQDADVCESFKNDIEEFVV